MNIIVYLHVCQKKTWLKSYDLLMQSIKKYGLYDEVKEIRIGVVNDTGKLIKNERFDDPKIKIIYVGKSVKYERPTLLHMKRSSYVDDKDTLYLYLHTKGIDHFGTPREKVVKKWITDMLYWNVKLWKRAVHALQTNDTYGSNYTKTPEHHYSGNFWWATAKYVKKLPKSIESYYIAPEVWIGKSKTKKMYCANNCDPHFKMPYTKEYITNRKKTIKIKMLKD